MSKRPWFLLLLVSLSLNLLPSQSRAQDDFEQEFMEAEGEYAEPEPMDNSTGEQGGDELDNTLDAESPVPTPDDSSDLQLSETPGDIPSFDDPETPAFKEAEVTTPAARPRFVKPEGPPGGGILKVPHPDAGKGLLRIEKNGTYVYKTKIPEKSRAASFRAAFQSSPSINNPQGVNFQDIYGSDGLVGLLGEYEWQFRKWGSFGLQLGSGLVYARGNGRFGDGRIAQEIYNLVVIPLSVGVIYRMEYLRRQWFVPFVLGGGTMYNLAEIRDDGAPPTFATAPAVYGGGGVHISISAWDKRGAFVLANDYGVSDLWFTVEARVIQGLSEELDFTNQTISGGFTVDF